MRAKNKAVNKKNNVKHVLVLTLIEGIKLQQKPKKEEHRKGETEPKQEERRGND